MTLKHFPLKLDEAQDFVRCHHRHSKPLKRHKFSIGCADRDLWCNSIPPLEHLKGVLTVDYCSSAWSGRRDHIEIRRLCTNGERNVASFLLGKAIQSCEAMGYKAIITYTRPGESGASLRAVGFQIQKWNYKYKNGDGLVQWIHSKHSKDSGFTKKALDQIKECIKERHEWLEWTVGNTRESIGIS